MLLVALACDTPTQSGIVDQVGHTVASGPVHRLVPLAPDVTELAFALGADELIVAAPTAADYPARVARLPRVREGDTESILAHHPDLVLATTAGNDPRVIDRLSSVGIRVLTLDITSCDRLAEACALVGSVVGRRTAGDRLASEIGRRCSAASGRARTLSIRRALYVVWWEPLLVAAPGTFHDDMLRRAGLHNLAPVGAGRYPTSSPELLLDPRLEVIVAPDEPDVRIGYNRVLSTPVGRRIAAGTIQVIWLPANPASRPGPRLVDALDALVTARESNP